VPTYKL